MFRQIEEETGSDRDRIVNLSDGVFAIAITLLVLHIRAPDIPENMVSSRLPTALLSLWPDYLGYILSFVGISAFWLIHHSIFRPIRSYDRTLLYLNFLFLMVVAFVPFPTSLLGDYGDHKLPVAIYAATLAVGRLLLTAIHWYSTRNNQLLDEPQDPATVRFFLSGAYNPGHLLALHRHLILQRHRGHLQLAGHARRGCVVIHRRFR
jgi:uncharacterized membrane protein